MLYVGGKYFKIAHLNVRRDKKDTALILKCKRWGCVTQIHIHWHILKVLALVLMILARVFMVLALVLMVLTALALMLLILAQSYHIFIDGFWGYLQSKKIISYRTIYPRQEYNSMWTSAYSLQTQLTPPTHFFPFSELSSPTPDWFICFDGVLDCADWDYFLQYKWQII